MRTEKQWNDQSKWQHTIEMKKLNNETLSFMEKLLSIKFFFIDMTKSSFASSAYLCDFVSSVGNLLSSRRDNVEPILANQLKNQPHVIAKINGIYNIPHPLKSRLKQAKTITMTDKTFTFPFPENVPVYLDNDETETIIPSKLIWNIVIR